MKKNQDMHLHVWVLVFGIILLAGAVGAAVFAVAASKYLALIGTAVLALLGAAAVLCWRNQGITMISDAEFTYSTMFGRETTYAFADITSIRRNPDSIDVFVGGSKVHVEDAAVLSDRLVDRLNAVAEKLNAGK